MQQAGDWGVAATGTVHIPRDVQRTIGLQQTTPVSLLHVQQFPERTCIAYTRAHPAEY